MDRRVEGTRAVVRGILPRALYRVTTEDGHDVVAHAPGGPGRNFVRLAIGDRVLLELAANDSGRGRIVKRV